MILHCGSADGGSGGTVIPEDHDLELFSFTNPTSATLATTTPCFLVVPPAW
jgi:hypothetical protein